MPDGSGLEVMAATPTEIEVGGGKYKLTPLTIGMYAEWVAWGKRQFFVELSGQLEVMTGDHVPEEMRTQMLAHAQDSAQDRTKVEALLSSVAGTVKGFELMLRPEHPDLSEEDARALVNSLGVTRAADLMDSASGLAEVSGKNPVGG